MVLHTTRQFPQIHEEPCSVALCGIDQGFRRGQRGLSCSHRFVDFSQAGAELVHKALQFRAVVSYGCIQTVQRAPGFGTEHCHVLFDTDGKISQCTGQLKQAWT